MTYSVNLPVTNFPMRGNLPKTEPEWLTFWQKIGLYNRILAVKRDRTFVIHDGPPYANGDIHLGHAFDKILKDIINKSKLLEKYAVNFVPGWDCHGLPIELNVEKKIGKPAPGQLETFIQACRTYALQQVAIQKESFQRLGVLADWEHPYLTLDFTYEAKIIEALSKILEAGYLVPGFKPVHWCADCGSALAEAEVEYQDKESPAIDVKFELLDSVFNTAYPVIMPIWTTTPWTLLANEAICVHQNLKYVLVEVEEQRTAYILNQELAEEALKRYQITNYVIVEHFLGQRLEKLSVQHPFLKKQVPVILARHVTNTAGTGIVHTAPAHGLDDYKAGLEYHLPVKILLDNRSRFYENVEYVGGLSVFRANTVIIDLLKERGNLLNATVIKHSYPHCWRHKKPLIFRATKQWFISIDLPGKDRESLKNQALEKLPAIKWYPASGENSLASMVEKRYDWCISRQRYYGVPLTLFVHRTSGVIHPEMARLIQQVIVPAIAQEGIIYWHRLDVQTFLAKYAPDDRENYVKVNDTLDVWFDSGVSHFAVLKERNLGYPADLYTEGVDQYRGWFQASLLTALAIDGNAPFRQILTHGFTVDQYGHKMSKSLGNVIAPKEIVQKYGADILRFWVASSFLHDDIRLSEQGLIRLTDSYRLIRNTLRFLLGNLHQFDGQAKLALDDLLPLDRYLIEILLHLIAYVRKSYEQYRFYQAMNEIQRILTNELSSFYFSVIKDRLYTLKVNHPARKSAQTVLWYWLEGLVRMIAPVLSFTAEETWQQMGNLKASEEPSVFLTTWDLFQNLTFKTVAKFEQGDWEKFLSLRETINRLIENLRVEQKLGSSLAAEVILYVSNEERLFWERFEPELRFLWIVSQVQILSLAQKGETAIEYSKQLFVEVKLSQAAKCVRCWHWHPSVGQNMEHPDLCERCIDNLFGTGEKRMIG